ncbi:MAG: oligosaccharide flippase family protein [Labilithrix sp.]|nr:oligosaccharide flippase family protein [Labilithrix sp.]MCW5811279.1 oligosaccharide flippase family protein [Labilithrix sp.]
MSSVAEGAVRGALWNVATTVVTRFAGLAGTLLLTHFIAPHDLGEVAAASVTVLTANMMTQVRYGNYLIAKKGTPEEAFNATVVHMGLGVLTAAVVIALREPIAQYVNSPNMGKYVPGFAIAGFIERLGYIPERTLTRDLKFRPMALARSAGEITYTVSSVGLAPFIGAMAVVVANIVRAVILVGMTLRAANFSDWAKRSPLKWSTIRAMTSYTAPGWLAGVAELAAAKWDNMLVSKYFGPHQHGLYNLAYNLADTPTGAVGEQVADVLFPSFAKLDPERREPALRRAMALLGLVIFPLSVGLGAVAPTVTATFFDERWQEVAPMLAILSVLSIAKTMASPLVGFLQAQHRQRGIMVLSVLKVIVLLVAIRIFAPHGPLWTCVGVGATFVLDTYLCLLFVRVLDGVKILPILVGLIPVVITSVIMFAGVYGAQLGLRQLGLRPGLLSLLLEVVAGGAVYVGAAFVVARPLAMDIVEQLMKIIRRRRASPS